MYLIFQLDILKHQYRSEHSVYQLHFNPSHYRFIRNVADQNKGAWRTINNSLLLCITMPLNWDSFVSSHAAIKNLLFVWNCAFIRLHCFLTVPTCSALMCSVPPNEIQFLLYFPLGRLCCNITLCAVMHFFSTQRFFIFANRTMWNYRRSDVKESMIFLYSFSIGALRQ